MPWIPIDKYRAEWNATDHTGRVVVLADRSWNHLYPQDAAEFRAMVDLLRNETPMYLATSSAGRRLATSSEEIGEEET